MCVLLQAARAVHVQEVDVSVQLGLLPNTFGVITADPPWSYGNAGARGGVDHHYQTMTDAAIVAMPVHELAAPNAALFLWVTNDRLMEGVGARVARAWGFTPKMPLTWDKQRMGVGRTFRGRTEHVIFATRGNLEFPHHNLTTLLDRLPQYPAEGAMMELPARTPVHSQKPEEFYALVSHCCPVGPYLELFGRGEERPGWVKWGNQAEGGIRLPALEAVAGS